MCVTSAWFSVSLNGSLHGFFSSTRDLRQGDLHSPYLFIIVMEAFNSLLLLNMKKKGFDYHPCCEELKLTHVCFTNDFFLVAGATKKSFKTIKNSLNDFGMITGLHPNLDKSLYFFVGVSKNDEMELGRILSIPIGTLLVRYLGVSLTTSALTAMDCKVFMDKIRNNIESWGHKNISFTGRIVFINSILFGASNYWAQCVFIPKEVCLKIEKMLKAFLWSGANNVKYQAKQERNPVGTMDQLIQVEREKFWSFKEKSIDSWIWKKFLKLRVYAKMNINIRLGNGKECNFLFDNWHELGPLHLVLTSQEVSYIGVKRSDSVAEVMGWGKIIEGRRATP
ncbi:hypothetical protein LIER_04848 [Lithospermum erythrorhizon]|uniref:Reverse transcriptase domain-containing protein n=1 Tax=Lithospermum erythrorhizon TaxID=34254 RepID=A0AAV3NZJ7_LITER